MKLIINTDGASRGNPGEAAVGLIIQDETGQLIFQGGRYLGKATNNEAEYLAVIKVLEILKTDFTKYLPAEVEVRADSQLIVQQLSGNYKVKNSRLRVLFDQVKCLESEVGRVYYRQIPRAENALADEQANIVLDETSNVEE